MHSKRQRSTPPRWSTRCNSCLLLCIRVSLPEGHPGGFSVRAKGAHAVVGGQPGGGVSDEER
eukprot:256309-Prorocentrum_minimum.AAC.1